MDKVKSLIPVVKADDEAELVDPQAVLRQECRANPHVASLLGRYEKCNERVSGKSKTTETCTEEFFDFLHELDHCVGHTLFSKLN